jgi:hypothetical protein
LNPCQEFFQRQRDPKELGPELRSLAHETILPWELQSASEQSPSSIQNDELLYRQMLDPVHWNSQKHEFTPGAFTDVDSIGMSVNRIKFTTLEDLACRALERVVKHKQIYPERPPRTFLGFTVLRCFEIREQMLQTENGELLRLFGVFDTASLEDKSHADICRLSGKESDKLHKARAKSILWELGNQYLVNKAGQQVPLHEF